MKMSKPDKYPFYAVFLTLQHVDDGIRLQNAIRYEHKKQCSNQRYRICSNLVSVNKERNNMKIRNRRI